jgi:murein L,D-transpeptidase YafK
MARPGTVLRKATGRAGALLAFALAALLALPAQAREPLAAGPEASLVNILLEINASNLDKALVETEKLLTRYPNFRLAHLIRGDLLLARARPLRTMGDVEHAPPERVGELRDEAKVRIHRSQEPPPAGRLPRYLLQLHPGQEYAIVADTASSRLFLFRNAGGEPAYVADYYISSGRNGAEKLRQGDQKTPIGVYFVTASVPRQKLTDFYGSGAFPISYPNEWDRRHGRNGHGIWLHGTPSDTYSRPPRASNGCVVLTNQDLDAIAGKLQVGMTPVVITGEMEWVDAGRVRAERQSLAQALEAWRRDWESRDVENYLRHYSKQFTSGKQGLAEWARQKRQVNAGKAWIKVRLSGVSMFRYPGQTELAVVTFDQDYASSNLSNRMKKRQYWIREAGAWRIIHEGAA